MNKNKTGLIPISMRAVWASTDVEIILNISQIIVTANPILNNIEEEYNVVDTNGKK